MSQVILSVFADSDLFRVASNHNEADQCWFVKAFPIDLVIPQESTKDSNCSDIEQARMNDMTFFVRQYAATMARAVSDIKVTAAPSSGKNLVFHQFMGVLTTLMERVFSDVFAQAIYEYECQGKSGSISVGLREYKDTQDPGYLAGIMISNQNYIQPNFMIRRQQSVMLNHGAQVKFIPTFTCYGDQTVEYCGAYHNDTNLYQLINYLLHSAVFRENTPGITMEHQMRRMLQHELIE